MDDEEGRKRNIWDGCMTYAQILLKIEGVMMCGQADKLCMRTKVIRSYRDDFAATVA